MTITKELGESFQRRFGHAAEHFFFSPGRVNLIGEHTDYNGGHVFPAAISVGTYAAVSLRDDDEIHAFSANFKDAGMVTFKTDDVELRQYDSWVKYVRGVIREMGKLGHEVPRGCGLRVVGDMPTASRLASSASSGLWIGVMSSDRFGCGMDTVSLVKLGQAREND